MAGAAGLAAAALLPAGAAAATLRAAPSRWSTADPPTAMEHITSYNNFYEFGMAKEDPERNAGRLTTEPWTVAVDGLCARPGSYAPRGHRQAGAARGAHLPAALRRGLVDGDPLDRLSARAT